MIDQFLNELLHGLQSVSSGSLFILMSGVTSVMALSTLGTEYAFPRLRVLGFTKSAAAILVSGIVSIVLLKFGLDLLEAHDPHLSPLVSLGVPAVAGLLVMVLLYGEVAGRRSFRWGRFMAGAVTPVISAVVPGFKITLAIFA